MMGENCVIAILGKRNTGKSVLVRDLIKKRLCKSDYAYGVACSGTEAVQPVYSETILPPELVHEEYTTDLLGNILSVQKKRVQAAKEREQLRDRYRGDPRMLAANPEYKSKCWLILDDVLHQSNVFLTDKNLKFAIYNGRHMHLTLAIVFQVPNPPGWGPNYRSQVDVIFVFREMSMQGRKKIWEMYASCIPTFALFNQIMDEVTANYGILVINQRTQSCNMEDIIFHYKADPSIRNVRHDASWQMCREMIYEDPDPSDAGAQRNLSMEILKNKNMVVDLEFE